MIVDGVCGVRIEDLSDQQVGFSCSVQRVQESPVATETDQTLTDGERIPMRYGGERSARRLPTLDSATIDAEVLGELFLTRRD